MTPKKTDNIPEAVKKFKQTLKKEQYYESN